MSDDTITWPEACQKVRFGEGLYQSCRDKVEGFTGFQNGAFDEEMFEGEEDENVDFDKLLRKTAQPIPEPPSTAREKKPKKAKKKAEATGIAGVLDEVMGGDLGKYLLYGGGAAALLWWLWVRNRQQVAVTDAPAIGAPAAPVALPGAAKAA